MTGDRPLAKLLFWSAWKTVCPEPYIDMRIEPGKEFSWRITYEFYQVSSGASRLPPDAAVARSTGAQLLHGDKTMNRRDAITSLSMAGGASLLPPGRSLAEALVPKLSAAYAQAVRGTAPVKIRDIKTILTAPNRIRLVVVKVETTEPGLVGWGCATFTQRALVVQTAVESTCGRS